MEGNDGGSTYITGDLGSIPDIKSMNIVKEEFPMQFQDATVPQDLPTNSTTNETIFTDSVPVKVEPPTDDEDPLRLEHDGVLLDPADSQTKSLAVIYPFNFALIPSGPDSNKLPDTNHDDSLPLPFTLPKNELEFNQISSNLEITGVEVAAGGNSGKISSEIGKLQPVTQTFKCSMCSKSYSNEAKLREHIPIHFESVKIAHREGYRCSVRSKSFQRPSELKIHKFDHYNRIANHFGCTKCRYVSKSNQDLKTHMHTHLEEQPYSCDVCDKKFKNKVSLKSHSRLHVESKHLKCDICEKTFFTKSKLKCHLVHHHTQRSYRCSVCPASFDRKTLLSRHIVSHFGAKTFKCPHCPSSYRKKHLLKAHSIAHLDDQSLKELEDLIISHLS